MLDLATIKTQYESHGFVHLPGLMEPALVARVRQAFDRSAAAHRDKWQSDVRDGRADSRFCDIPNILDCDDVFVDLVDLPSLMPILLSVVGEDVQLNQTHARLFPPGKTFTAAWHSDLSNAIGIDLAHSHHFFVKVHYFFEDLRPDQGCLAFIPGSHSFPVDYPRPRIKDAETSPMVVKVVPKAGDLVLFNTHVLHMALDNDSPAVRKSLIYAYSHFWVKHYANAVPTALERYATTPQRCQLFGVEEEGVLYWDQRYHGKPRPTMVSSARSVGGRIFKRVMNGSTMNWRRA